MKRLVCLGFGYTARFFAERLERGEWDVLGTRRSVPPDASDLAPAGLLAFAGGAVSPQLAAAVKAATHVLVSVPPDAEGDVVIRRFREHLVTAPRLRWLGYLSSTGVYGDHQGATVDEESPCRPTSERARRRLAAETRWRSLCADHGLPVHVFRLSGIYGPGRSALDRVRAGATTRILRPGHLFNRIHVDDIGRALAASIGRPDPGRVYNVSDDEPAPQADLIEHACRLLGVEPGPVVPFERAKASMPPGMLSFWADNRRVDNGRLKAELDLRLRYPGYREGLRAILESEKPSRGERDASRLYLD